jgi:hypothetical protein
MKFTSNNIFNNSTEQKEQKEQKKQKEVTYTSSDKIFILKITVTDKKTITRDYSNYDYYFIKSIEIIIQSQSLHINLDNLKLYIYIDYKTHKATDITINDITNTHVILYTIYTIVNDNSSKQYITQLPFK